MQKLQKKNFPDIRKTRPQNIEIIKQALNDYLKQCRFENCFQNEGYIRALGFSEDKQSTDKKLKAKNDTPSK